MITTKSNYRVEIEVRPLGRPTHVECLRYGTEMISQIEMGHGLVQGARKRVVWDVRHECETCGDDLESVDDEAKCIHCEEMMCHLCNCNTHSRPVCEGCWEEGKR